MAEITNYTNLGINKWLEQDGSLLSDFQDIQFYSTMNVDPDTGEAKLNEVSAGLATINTGKMSQPEIDNLLGNIRATQLTSGDVSQPINLISGHIQSANFITGTTGWQINADGDAEFSDITLTGGTIKYGKTSFTDSANKGYYIGSEGIYIGDAADATKMKFTVSSGALDLIGTISSRSTVTLAAAIDSSGDLINDIINVRLDSSSKKILSDFSFGTDDYAGGVKTGDITWNTSTGALTGGTGIVISRWGIIGANAGTPTFTIDASSGDATFAGTLSAAAGTLGTVTAGTLTGVTIKTATAEASDRIYLTGSTIRFMGGGETDTFYSLEIGALTSSRISFFSHIGAANIEQTRIDSDDDKLLIQRYENDTSAAAAYTFHDDYFSSTGTDLGITGVNSWNDAFFTGKVNSNQGSIIQTDVNSGIGFTVNRNLPSNETSGALVEFLNDNADDDQKVFHVIQDGSGDAIYVYNRDFSHTENPKGINILSYSNSTALYIEHNSDDDSNDVYAIYIQANNVGTQLPGGIDMSSFSVDEPLIKATSDTINTAGTLTHQMAVDIGGTVYYLCVYTTGSTV